MNPLPSFCNHATSRGHFAFDCRTFVTSPYHVSFPSPRTSTSIPTAKSDVFNGSFALRFGFTVFFALTFFAFAFAFAFVFVFVVAVAFVVAFAVFFFVLSTGVAGALPVIAVNCAAIFAISALLAAVSTSRRASASSSRRVALASIRRNVSNFASSAIVASFARARARDRRRREVVVARVVAASSTASSPARASSRDGRRAMPSRRTMPRAAPSSSSSASSSSDDGDDDGVDETLAAMSDDAINARVAPSFYALTRSIDREDRRAFHRVHSIARDAAFVEAQGERFLRDSTRAAFANARAGAWYAGGGRFAYETCYFKSTDGHNNNWTMSATRLNRRVAMACAAGRGGMIVDATRSAVKRFPDALSKTVPIWCDALNRACARAKRDAGAADADDRAWFEGPHLPEWVAEHERNSIRALVPEFEASLKSTGWDVGELAAILEKPFRCVWVSRGEDGAELSLESLAEADFTPLILVTASAPLHWRGERRVGVNGHSFAYVPGAADDEESWSRGLTADMFHEHRDALLHASERDIDNIIARIVDGRIGKPRELDPRSRLAPRGCAPMDSRAAEEANRSNGAICDGGMRELSPECGIGRCSIASFAVYDRADMEKLADAFLHVGETVVDPSKACSTAFLHVPARKAKVSRTDLMKALPRCIDFARRTFETPGARLCVTCDDGVDHSVAVAVALCIAMGPSPCSNADLDKDDVRKQLAAVSKTHPDARPTRASLKQVYNFFLHSEVAD